MTDYKLSRGAYLNCEKAMFSGMGEYGIPQLNAIQVNLSGLRAIPFSDAIREKHPQDKIVHFFQDDYKFERVWNDPDRYIPVLSRFAAVIAPDFSLYSDMPKACQIFNHYRKHWCAKYWSDRGIKVIPSIQWDFADFDTDSIDPQFPGNCFDWCLDGEPQNSTICISTIGTMRSNNKKRKFLAAFDKIVKQLHPTHIVIFGKLLPEISERFAGRITELKSINLERKEKLSVRRARDVP